ncbi:2-hydroxymuconic semialdehyde dehydrogenase [Shewanella hanedai]|uniref:2-hydroxymuconic semialdehyde dehydrogenase n=1 Tax=Shewanella hanedai TaxID=25 RepID=A0A553JPE6_SHEHA|nr:2-hydroxymuconic semialdehyde dehydrogenase [Shewanella hanedai]TRY14271.1 2-hydroxymuconic semialdehyde dehydrogenase [Shewanella hanedai]GGI81486.1 2-hydroxymuconic semialdehyde dehydrogenase [Shewanella hanedai]
MSELPILTCYIDGDFVNSDTHFDNINPVNGQAIAHISEATPAMIENAVASARAAQESSWGKMTVNKRCALLHKVADRMAEREEEFIAAEIADTGKSLFQVKTIDIPRGTANFRFFADLAKFNSGETFITDTPTGDKALNYSINKPLGVVGVISPWNLPLLLATWKIAPAMACGNSVILKPSEETSSTAFLLAQVMDEVGIPKGAFNLILGRGRAVGDALTSAKGIDAITFTGASSTGKQIMKSVANSVKPISFELGGKNSAIVFADADLDKAIKGVTRSSFTNCGQVCLCTEKVYVHRSIFEPFVEGLKQAALQIKIGYPTDKDVFMGPLVSKVHQQKVLSYYQLAKDEGATFVAGGGVPQFNDERDMGCFIEPTIITGLSDNARVNQEEVFGPICHISVFDDEDEVIDRVNNTDYGLAASVWTENLSRAHRVSPQLDVGLVWVNTWFLRDLRAPFGGVKLSGIGREGGKHSLAFYSEPINICIHIDS